MAELSRRGLLDGQYCTFGKQKRVGFTTTTHNTKGTLDYIHSNMWGPSRVLSSGGTIYMLTIIDDFSRRVWVFSFFETEE